MPIVSEHPRSTGVLQQLSAEGDANLEGWVAAFSERRKAYEASPAHRRALVEQLEYDDREDLDCRRLLELLEAREAAVDRMRDDLDVMNRELLLLKREMRRARRKFTEGTGMTGMEEFRLAPQQDTPAPPARDPRTAFAPAEIEEYDAGVPQLPSIKDVLQLTRDGQVGAWLRPWLRGFLPNSA